MFWHKRSPSVWIMHDALVGDNNNGRAIAEAIPHAQALALSGDSFRRGHQKDSVQASFADLDGNPFGQHEIDRPHFPDVLINSTSSHAHLRIRGLEQTGFPHFKRTVSTYLAQPDLVLDRQKLVPLTNINVVFTHQMEHSGVHVPNALVCDVVPTRVTSSRLAAATRRWSDRFSDMMRHGPLHAVVMGERIDKDKTLSIADAERLANHAIQSTKRAEGSLIVITSPRTMEPEKIHSLFQEKAAAAGVPFQFHGYGGMSEAKNPYLGIVGLADKIIATDDSMSVASDLAASGIRAHLFNRLLTDTSLTPLHHAYNQLLLRKGFLHPIATLEDATVKTVPFENSAGRIASVIQRQVDDNMPGRIVDAVIHGGRQLLQNALER